jgi:hypothetical protein
VRRAGRPWRGHNADRRGPTRTRERDVAGQFKLGSVTAGVPLAFVAEALVHADTRMVSKHYAHLAPNVVHDAIRANLPSFGVQTDGRIQKLWP